MTAPALSVRSLGVTAGGRRVLNDVSFEVASGDVVALIGTNGSGKTTLLTSAVGLRRFDRGEILLGGGRRHGLPELSRSIAWLPDDAVPPAELRVAEQLELGRRLGGASREEAAAIAVRLGLEDLARARCGELSRGEARRVLLHGALCARRPLLVLDKPFATFDPVQLRDVVALLRERAAEGAGVLLSVHQLSDAEKVATGVVALHRGQVLAAGRLADVVGARGSLEAAYLALVEAAEASC